MSKFTFNLALGIMSLKIRCHDKSQNENTKIMKLGIFCLLAVVLKLPIVG